MDIGLPFIRLPYRFDAEQLAAEVSALPDDAWMEHPRRLNGNTAVALISKDGSDNDDFSGHMMPTPHLDSCDYLRQVLASFNEVLGRSRLMKLAAGAEVARHVDFNYHWYSRVRIHIPVITDPRVTFYCADQHKHMAAGESWIFNAWRQHRVTNESDVDRVHLVVDTAGSARFWSMLRGAVAGGAEAKFVPFEAGKQVQLRTEKYNVPQVMAPGEMDALVSDLIRDFESNPSNEPALVGKYRTLLIEFSKDWRQLWLQFGEEDSARPKYKAAIDKVFNALEPNRRALVTKSNDLGVNPIIVQRILRTALAGYEVGNP